MASRRKWSSFRETLAEAGVSQALIEGVHSPVGLAIGARSPAELAISIMAEIVQVRWQPAE